MLPDSFYDWWFAPWACVRDASDASVVSVVSDALPPALDLLGRRDGYRAWCANAGVPADIPAQCDPGWAAAATGSAEDLIASATRYAGLIAARRQERELLEQLPPAQRKWCMSIALTQPLQACAPGAGQDALGIAERGLVELAMQLEPAFSGMWPRLRLLLDSERAARVDAALRTMPAGLQLSQAAARRAQRCWSLCRQDAAAAR